VERYCGEGRSERYAKLAEKLVSRSPDLIFTLSSPMVLHFMDATRTIPIVGFTADPITGGISPSLAAPAGNVTGVVNDAGNEIWGKRLSLLREVVPHVK